MALARSMWVPVGLAVAVALFASNGPARAQIEGQARILVGAKILDPDEWDPIDSQIALGAMIDVGGRRWPVRIAIDLLGSFENDTAGDADLKGRTAELGVGVRKVWALHEGLRPHVGAGLALAWGSVQGTAAGQELDGDDVSGGIWAGGGVGWRFGRRLEVGLAARWSTADVTILDGDFDAGGLTAGVTVGWIWPPPKDASP